jgi:hypothetical protein
MLRGCRRLLKRFTRSIRHAHQGVAPKVADEATKLARSYLKSLSISSRQVERLEDVPARKRFDAASQKLRFQLGPVIDDRNLLRDPFSVGTTLARWPKEQIVKCLVSYHPDDEPMLLLEQEAQLKTLYDATRANLSRARYGSGSRS